MVGLQTVYSSIADGPGFSTMLLVPFVLVKRGKLDLITSFSHLSIVSVMTVWR